MDYGQYPMDLPRSIIDRGARGERFLDVLIIFTFHKMSYQVGAYDPNYYARRRRNFMYAAAGSAARYYAPRAASYMGNVAMDYGRRAAGYAANTLSTYVQGRRKSSEAVVGSKRLRTNTESQQTQEFPNNPSRALRPVETWAPPSGNPRMYLKRRYRPMVKRDQSRKTADILMDIICPPCEENYREPGQQLDWVANRQACVAYVHLDHAKIQQLITKCTDVTNIAFSNAIASTNSARRFKYTGGKQIHTFINTCTHHVTLHLYEYKCINYTSQDAQQAWSVDLNRDDTLTNAQAPLNVDQNTFTARNFPKNRHLQLYRDWKNLKRVKFEIPPGEKAEYTMYHPAFEFDNNDMIPLVGPTEQALLNPKYTKCLMAIAYGVEVTDSTSTAVTSGSGHLAHMMEEFNYFRAQPPTKYVNRFASGSWGDIALQSSEQAINMETDAQDGAYAEDI